MNQIFGGRQTIQTQDPELRTHAVPFEDDGSRFVGRRSFPASIANRLRNTFTRAYRRVEGVFRPIPPQNQNFDFNKVLWDQYARTWTPERPHNRLPGGPAEEPLCEFVGDEWGTVELPLVLQEYVWPNITPDSSVAEIGSGGGRLAYKVSERVRHLYCLDVSKEMLAKCRAALADRTNVSYVLLTEPRLPADLSNSLDFVYAFGVFVHLDLHVMWKYFQDISRVLKPGGRAFLHTANLKAPNGWARFAGQQAFSVPSFYFVSPEIIAILAEHAGLTILKDSQGREDTAWHKRDYLVALQK